MNISNFIQRAIEPKTSSDNKHCVAGEMTEQHVSRFYDELNSVRKSTSDLAAIAAQLHSPKASEGFSGVELGTICEQIDCLTNDLSAANENIERLVCDIAGMPFISDQELEQMMARMESSNCNRKARRANVKKGKRRH